MSARGVGKTCLLGYDLHAGPKTVLKPAVRTMLVYRCRRLLRSVVSRKTVRSVVSRCGILNC
jgi:hypothetical protein